MSKDLLEKRINDEVDKCNRNLNYKKLKKDKAGKGVYYCELLAILKFPFECDYQGEVVWLETETKKGNNLYYPYRRCKKFYKVI